MTINEIPGSVVAAPAISFHVQAAVWLSAPHIWRMKVDKMPSSQQLDNTFYSLKYK